MTTEKPSWTLSGVVLVACNCDYGCPCNFNAAPTHGKCEGGWTWHIQHGSFNGVSLNGVATRIKAGDALDVQSTTIRNPVTGAEVHPGVILPEGIIVKQADLRCSTVFRVREGITMDHSGQYTALGPFEYAFP
jgi:hypothetical protein